MLLSHCEGVKALFRNAGRSLRKRRDRLSSDSGERLDGMSGYPGTMNGIELTILKAHRRHSLFGSDADQELDPMLDPPTVLLITTRQNHVKIWKSVALSYCFSGLLDLMNTPCAKLLF